VTRQLLAAREAARASTATSLDDFRVAAFAKRWSMLQALILLAEEENKQQGMSPFSFLPLILIAVLFYLLLIRPMKKQEAERQAMASNLKKNDEVLFGGGIYGTVTDVSETDDKITVKIADNVRIKVTKASIVRNLTNEETAKAAKSQGIKLPDQGIKPS
jgi:preprotein translocase subunit YajC